MIVYAGPAAEYANLFLDRLLGAILYPLITLMTVVALVVFLYGCMEYVLNATNDDKRAQGQKHILWGLVGLLVMLSAFAILQIAANTFNINTPASGGTFTPTGSESVGEVRIPGRTTP